MYPSPYTSAHHTQRRRAGPLEWRILGLSAHFVSLGSAPALFSRGGDRS